MYTSGDGLAEPTDATYITAEDDGVTAKKVKARARGICLKHVASVTL